ncbi:putative disease resistance RPP13 protein 3 [Spatholobus suberectus]|nr:putative disease resistance RPP13 protein 3 [Spatholobus suberectus]
MADAIVNFLTEKLTRLLVQEAKLLAGVQDKVTSLRSELCYDSLPARLKPCFLYFGVYPEDYRIPVKQLIQLWISEGLLTQETSGSTHIPEPEYIAQQYLGELVDRSLVQVVHRSSDGSVKTCRIHDVLRHLCMSESRDDRFFERSHFARRYNQREKQSEVQTATTQGGGGGDVPGQRRWRHRVVLQQLQSKESSKMKRIVLPIVVHSSALCAAVTLAWALGSNKLGVRAPIFSSVFAFSSQRHTSPPQRRTPAYETKTSLAIGATTAIHCRGMLKLSHFLLLCSPSPKPLLASVLESSVLSAEGISGKGSGSGQCSGSCPRGVCKGSSPVTESIGFAPTSLGLAYVEKKGQDLDRCGEDKVWKKKVGRNTGGMRR